MRPYGAQLQRLQGDAPEQLVLFFHDSHGYWVALGPPAVGMQGIFCDCRPIANTNLHQLVVVWLQSWLRSRRPQMTGIWLTAFVALWLVVLLLVAIVIGVLRHIGILYGQMVRSSGPPTELRIGQLLPDLNLLTSNETTMTIGQFAGRISDVVLISPGCTECERLLDLLVEGDVAGDPADRRVIISIGDMLATREILQSHQVSLDDTVLIDTGDKIRRLWGAHTTPVTIVVDEHLMVVRQVVGVVDSRHLLPLPQQICV